jgi:hypothetical protein
MALKCGSNTMLAEGQAIHTGKCDFAAERIQMSDITSKFLPQMAL